jgi:hypothetical protein
VAWHGTPGGTPRAPAARMRATGFEPPASEGDSRAAVTEPASRPSCRCPPRLPFGAKCVPGNRRRVGRGRAHPGGRPTRPEKSRSLGWPSLSRPAVRVGRSVPEVSANRQSGAGSFAPKPGARRRGHAARRTGRVRSRDREAIRAARPRPSDRATCARARSPAASPCRPWSGRERPSAPASAGGAGTRS